MMCFTKWRTATMLAIAVGLLMATYADAAKPGRGRGPGPGGYSRGRAPAYHGIYYGQSNWNYVVPQRSRYAGGYYSVGPKHYYSPTPIVSTLTAPPATAAAPPVVAAQKPTELTFGGFSRYQDLSGRLALDVNALCLDMHHNYQDNKNFGDVYAEAFTVLQAAKYLQGDEHKGDHDLIGKRVARMHLLVHHVMHETSGWTRTSKKQVGTESLDEKTADVEAIIHHLVYDVGIKLEEDHDAGVAPLPEVDLREEAPQPVAKR